VHGPARTGRRARGPAPVELEPPPLPFLLSVAQHAAAHPAASLAVKQIRELVLRAVSNSHTAPVLRRFARQGNRIECKWSLPADLEISLRHLSGQHDFYAAAELGLTLSCLRSRKTVLELPPQIRGETVAEVHPAWAEDTIDAWGLRLQQCHAYRDIKDVEFYFWVKKGEHRLFSERAKDREWFTQLTSGYSH